MQPQISLTFTAPDLESFLAALDALRGQPASVTVKPPIVAPVALESPLNMTTAEPKRGPLETEYLKLSGSERMRMRPDEVAAYGSNREACAKARLMITDSPAPPLAIPAAEPTRPQVQAMELDDDDI